MQESVINQPEQRLTFRLLSYWNRIRGTRDFPSLHEINIGEITEIWHYTFTLAVTGPPDEHKFHYFGPQLAAIFGVDHTGDLMADVMQDSMIVNTIGFYDKVITQRAPVSESSSFHLGEKEVRYRSLIVPLSSDGQTIDYLLGTTNYKIF